MVAQIKNSDQGSEWDELRYPMKIRLTIFKEDYYIHRCHLQQLTEKIIFYFIFSGK